MDFEKQSALKRVGWSCNLCRLMSLFITRWSLFIIWTLKQLLYLRKWTMALPKPNSFHVLASIRTIFNVNIVWSSPPNLVNINGSGQKLFHYSISNFVVRWELNMGNIYRSIIWSTCMWCTCTMSEGYIIVYKVCTWIVVSVSLDTTCRGAFWIWFVCGEIPFSFYLNMFFWNVATRFVIYTMCIIHSHAFAFAFFSIYVKRIIFSFMCILHHNYSFLCEWSSSWT